MGKIHASAAPILRHSEFSPPATLPPRQCLSIRESVTIMQTCQLDSIDLKPTTRRFYQRALAILHDCELPFLVCGSYAIRAYTGITPHVKDLDIFVRRGDCQRVLAAFSAAGYLTEVTFSHWLGKVLCRDDFIDVIFSSGNGVCEVDDTWFSHAEDGELFGMPVKLCPAEEIIWQKAFVMERERHDGADVLHLLRARADSLDWERLLHRFGPHWRVLLAHLVLFGFVYPAHRSKALDAVTQMLIQRLKAEMNSSAPSERLCLGTLLSRSQYLVDIERWGYEDARIPPHGTMTTEEIRLWTKAIPTDVPGEAV
jgi:hypothetical protein